jgi:hypothetical protein
MAAELEKALNKAVEWLDSAEEHKSVRIDIKDGVSTTQLFLAEKFPGLVQFGGEQVKIPIPKFMCEIFPSLSIEIESISMRKWHSIGVGSFNSFSELVFETAPNERQQKDRDDFTIYQDLSSKLYKKIFPVWCQVATGSRRTCWVSAQSSDALTFFCCWLICVEPTGNKAQFFLDASEQEITQELDTNYLEYTDPITDPQTTEYYLIGDDLSDTTALACFRERWPSLTMAPSGGCP